MGHTRWENGDGHARGRKMLVWKTTRFFCMFAIQAKCIFLSPIRAYRCISMHYVTRNLSSDGKSKEWMSSVEFYKRCDEEFTKLSDALEPIMLDNFDYDATV